MFILKLKCLLCLLIKLLYFQYDFSWQWIKCNLNKYDLMATISLLLKVSLVHKLTESCKAINERRARDQKLRPLREIFSRSFSCVPTFGRPAISFDLKDTFIYFDTIVVLHGSSTILTLSPADLPGFYTFMLNVWLSFQIKSFQLPGLSWFNFDSILCISFTFPFPRGSPVFISRWAVPCFSQ